MMNQYKPELTKNIQTVLTENNTAKDILDKISVEYPELIEYKTKQRGSMEDGKRQLLAEISSVLGRGEGRHCVINRNEFPIQYSPITDDYDANKDINECINIDESIGNDETSEAIEERLNIGYIYIIDTHLQYNNQEIVKIGKANNIDERMNSLNRDQYCFQKPTILYQFKVDRPYKIEHAIHSLLDKGRVNPKKEGFYRDYVESNIDLIKSMIEMFAID